jgi:hypothetical protein
MNYKDSVRNAINNHYKRNEIKPARRKNKTPEKDVVREVMEWAGRHEVDLTIVDSRAVFNPITGLYTSRCTSEVFPDLCGNYHSLAVFIEVKARGRRSTASDQQKQFLARKILQGCYAVVADCPEYIEETIAQFMAMSPFDRKDFLLAELP